MMIKLLKATIAVAVTICLVSGCAFILHSKTWYPKMNEFYKYPEDYDVWFLGSSHAIMSTLPEEMWQEHKIKSYNFACYGQTLVMDYWITKNLLRVSKPKLVVIDVGVIASDEKYSKSNIGSVRKMVTGLPLSMDKIHMINDLFEGDLREEMLFPFSSDHYNWEYLTVDNFLLKESYELGADQNVFGGRGKEDYVLVTQTTIPNPVPIEDAKDVDSVNSMYLRKLIQLCLDNGINVLLDKCPLNTSSENLRKYAHGFMIGQEYGIPYFDGFTLHGVFDGDTDMWDKRHLNSLGARKYTYELGRYIADNYPDLIQTSDNNQQLEGRWHSRYQNYLKWLDSELPLQSDFYSYLMLCTHPQYTIKVEFNSSGNAVRDDIVWKFIDAMECCETSMVDDEDFDIHITVYTEDGTETDNEKFVFNRNEVTAYVKLVG